MDVVGDGYRNRLPSSSSRTCLFLSCQLRMCVEVAQRTARLENESCFSQTRPGWRVPSVLSIGFCLQFGVYV